MFRSDVSKVNVIGIGYVREILEQAQRYCLCGHLTLENCTSNWSERTEAQYSSRWTDEDMLLFWTDLNDRTDHWPARMDRSNGSPLMKCLLVVISRRLVPQVTALQVHMQK